MSLPKLRKKIRSTPGLVEPIEKKASRDQQKQHKEEADGKIQDQQEPLEQGRRPDTQSKLHTTGTQLLGDEEHDVLAQHQEKCENCRATNQDPRPDPRYFISWVVGLSSIRKKLGPHGGVAGGRGCCVIEGQVDRRGIRELFFAQEKLRNDFFLYAMTKGPTHAGNTLPDIERHARPGREVRPSIRSTVAAQAPQEDRGRQLSNTTQDIHARTTTAAGSVCVVALCVSTSIGHGIRATF